MLVYVGLLAIILDCLLKGIAGVSAVIILMGIGNRRGRKALLILLHRAGLADIPCVENGFVALMCLIPSSLSGGASRNISSF